MLIVIMKNELNHTKKKSEVCQKRYLTFAQWLCSLLVSLFLRAGINSGIS